MGSGIAILFWGTIAGVGFLACPGGLVVFVAGRKRKSRLLQLIGGAPFVMLASVCVMAAVVFPYSLVRACVPRYVYEDTFHRKPSTDVKGIQSHSWSFINGAHVYLRFRSPYRSFKEILPNNLARVGSGEYRARMQLLANDSPPAWWNNPKDKTSEIWLLSTEASKGGKFTKETTLMTYDSQTQTIKYLYVRTS